MFSTSTSSSRDTNQSNSPSGTLRLDEVPRQRFSELAEALKKYLPHSLNVLSMLTVDLRYGLLEHLEARVLSPQHPCLWGKVVVITPVATSRTLRSLAVFWCVSEVADDDIFPLLQSLPQHCWTDPLMLRAVPSHLVPKLDEMIHTLSRGHLRAGIPNDVKVTILDGSPPPVPRLPEGFYVADIEPSYANQVLSKFVGRFTECPNGFAKCFKSLPASGVFFTKSKPKSSTAEITEYSSIKIKQIVSEQVSNSSQYSQISPKGNVDGIFSQIAIESSGTYNEKLEERMDFKSNSKKDAHEKVLMQSTNPFTITSNVKMSQTQKPSATISPSDDLIQSQTSTDELVSWIILKPGCDSGMLYTLDEHRGKGLAKAAVLHLANRLYRDEQIIFSFVDNDNDVSFKLFQHLGFSEFTDMKICFYYPPGFTFSDVIRQYSDNIPDDVKKYL